MRDFALMMIAGVLFGISLSITVPPKVKPCDGQLITGDMGVIEFRFCVHPARRP